MDPALQRNALFELVLNALSRFLSRSDCIAFFLFVSIMKLSAVESR
jgi:hypothetical protein